MVAVVVGRDVVGSVGVGVGVGVVVAVAVVVAVGVGVAVGVAVGVVAGVAVVVGDADVVVVAVGVGVGVAVVVGVGVAVVVGVGVVIPNWGQRVQDLLWATGWQLWVKSGKRMVRNPEFLKSWGYGVGAVAGVKNGKRPSIAFVRRLKRLEQMYAADLEALRNGAIVIVEGMRYDRRKGETALQRLDLAGGRIPPAPPGLVSSLAAQGADCASDGAVGTRRPEAEQR